MEKITSFTIDHNKLQPGVYELSTSMKAEEMLEIVCHTEEETEEGGS